MDVSHLTGSPADQTALINAAVPKTLVLDMVSVLKVNGIAANQIPSKIKGLAFGEDIVINGVTEHSLYVANDNDFLPNVAGDNMF